MNLEIQWKGEKEFQYNKDVDMKKWGSFILLIDWLVVSEYLKGENICLTHLVEQEIWPVPWDWEHAPHQKQALHYQVGREGVTENISR